MVHFGSKLAANKVAKWSDFYVDYDRLKKIIKKVSKRVDYIRKQSVNLNLANHNHGKLPARLDIFVDAAVETESDSEVKRGRSQSSAKYESPTHRKCESQRLLPRKRFETETAVDIFDYGTHKLRTNACSDNTTSDGMSTDLLPAELLSENPDNEFVVAVKEEAEKVEEFYRKKLLEFRDKIHLLKIAIGKLRKSVVRRDLDAEKSSRTPLSKEVLSADSARRAFIDVYREMNYLHNYTILNYTAFVKILKKHDKATGLKARRQLTTHLYTYNEGFINAPELLLLIQTVETSVAKAYYGGNITVARSELLMKQRPLDDWEMLHIGMRVGMVMVLGLWVIWDVAIDGFMRPEEAQLPIPVSRMFRAFGYFTLCFWLWGGCVYVWNNERINYIYLFEFDPRRTMQFEDILYKATTMTLVYLSMILFYVKISRGEVGNISPNMAKYIPLLLFGYMLGLMIFPLKQTSHILGVLGQVFFGAFYEVTFFSAYVADVLTSLARPFVDIAFTFCFFFTGEWHRLYDDKKNLHKGHLPTCADSFEFTRIISPLVISLPLFFRAIQNLRRYYDTGKRFPQLPNFLKYAMAHALVLLGALHPSYGSFDDEDSFRWVWIVALSVSTLYTYTWDVYLDWGLGDLSCNFLRPQLMYPYKSAYYVAILFDFFTRFTWSLTLIPQVNILFGTPQNSYLPLLLGTIELFRRAMWSLFRVEYEHLYNALGYRRVEYVPLHFDTPLAQPEKRGKQKFSVIVELVVYGLFVTSIVFIAFWTDFT